MSDPSNYGQYTLFYQSELDFKTYKDDMNEGLLAISTLDNRLFRLLQAYGDTKYNIPIWRDSGGTWVLNDSVWVWHDGIKVLYSSSYQSSATSTNLLSYRSPNDILGFHHGIIGDTAHTIPAMAEYNITQNNGATTFIGNDILSKFLIQGNQTPGGLHVINEIDFGGANNSQPYTRSNYSLKNLLPNGTGAVDVSVRVWGKFDGAIDSGATTPDPFIGFVLFEIDQNDLPVIVAGEFKYDSILQYNLPASPFSGYAPPSNGVFDSGLVNITLNYDRVYVFSIIYDGVSGSGIGLAASTAFDLSALNFSISSKFDSGTSGVPIAAPSFPASPAAAFRLGTLLEKIVPNLPTRQTNGYGFPTPVTTPYTGVSDFLNDPTVTAIGDCVPYQILITSAYCLHDLQGQSYISMSLNELFDFCKKVLGCGAAIEGDSFRIENLGYFFDSSTMILDLGYDVSNLEIEQSIESIGSNLKLGYSKIETNRDFGIDPVHTELYFNTPVSTLPGTMDYQEGGIVVDPFAIEKIRAQQVSQPIGTSYDPSSPSSDNQSVALYCLPSPTIPLYTHLVYDPVNNPVDTDFYQLTQRNGVNLPAAQSYDSTASTAPYIYGMRYPDTAYNIELSPCRTLKRDNGSMLRSVLDTMDADYLTFRNTTVMQYNNTVTALSGIESNLEVGAGASPITEFKDILIGSLPDPLWKPIKIKVKSKYPVNMYQILNNNPNGYVRFYWKEKAYLPAKEYKGFIVKATQSAGTSEATVFELLATPDMVI